MFELLVNTFVVLFIVVDPVGVAVMFPTLSSDADGRFRRHMARRAALLSLVLLLAFFFTGDWILKALGIGVPAFRIAGGLLLLLLAIDMVFARQSGLRSTTLREREEAVAKHDISVFPLAFPLLAGPGALTTVLLMANSTDGGLVTAGMVGVIVLVMGVTLAALYTAERLYRILGETGANVLSRVFGLILAALAIQYMVDGILPLVQVAR
jgi:multiple antibiotic resistance protein